MRDRWEAICKGATLRGLEGPLVPKRKCPRNYGTDVSRRFRDGVDSEADAWTDPFDKVKMAEGYILWLYEKVSRNKRGAVLYGR